MISPTLAVDPREVVLEPLLPGAVCGELGVWQGAFSQRILERRPSRLHLIDPWLYLPEFGDRCFGKRGDNDQAAMDAIHDAVAQQFGDRPEVTIHRKTTEDAAADFDDQYFDWIYIDANHNYEFVRADLLAYLPKVKVGGLITGDDFNFPRCPNGGPKRAVEECLAEGRVRLARLKNNQYMLQRVG